jgi:hypothetical protein
MNNILDLNVLVNNSLKKISEGGKVQEIIDKRLENTVESIINDLLNDWSDFGKALKEEVKKKLVINLGELDIATYNTLVLNAVKEKLDKVITIQGVEKIKESMDKMLADVKPEYRLSEIIEELRESEKGSHDYGDRMTLIIEASDRKYINIYLDDDEEENQYRCKYMIRLKEDGIVWNIKSDDRDFSKNNELGALFGIEELLFKIYATGAKIVLDEGEDSDDYNLDYYDED